MRIKVYGEPHYSTWSPSYLGLVRRGLQELGHELVENPEDADVLYADDPCGYKQIADDTIKLNKPSVLNILDIPTYAPNWKQVADFYYWCMTKVNAVTSISQTTRKQLLELFDINSDVIYHPAKTLTNYNMPRSSDKLKFLFVGRANSTNKRFHLVREMIEKYYEENQLVVVGSENPGFGNYRSIVTDSELNIYYNLCDYVLSPSSHGGIELPPCEAVLMGKFPIVAKDCECSQEFLPDFCCEPTADAMYQQIQMIESNKTHYNWLNNQYARKFETQLNYLSVAQNIEKVIKSL
jgi:glycosyltransferase involved in cell wall biosynthesis